MEFFKHLFSSDFMPHGFCYLWDPRILCLHVISDGLIVLSYYCIPIVAIYFIRKNRDLPFSRVLWMLGADPVVPKLVSVPRTNPPAEIESVDAALSG